MTKYTHQDADGMWWRMEGSRPISKLADDVTEHFGEQPNISFGVPVDQSALRAKGVPEYEPPEGASKVECETCGNLCWQGPRQVKLVKDNPGAVIVMCALCASKLSLGNDYDVQHLGGKGGRLKDS